MKDNPPHLDRLPVMKQGGKGALRETIPDKVVQFRREIQPGAVFKYAQWLILVQRL